MPYLDKAEWLLLVVVNIKTILTAHSKFKRKTYRLKAQSLLKAISQDELLQKIIECDSHFSHRCVFSYHSNKAGCKMYPNINLNAFLRIQKVWTPSSIKTHSKSENTVLYMQVGWSDLVKKWSRVNVTHVIATALWPTQPPPFPQTPPPPTVWPPLPLRS